MTYRNETYTTEMKSSKNFHRMPEEWCDSSDGHMLHNCWHDSKITQSEKAFCVSDLYSIKSVTTIQWGFWRKFHKNPPCVNSIHFLGLSHHCIATMTAVHLVIITGVKSFLLPTTQEFLKLSFQWYLYTILVFLSKYLMALRSFVFTLCNNCGEVINSTALLAEHQCITMSIL